MSCYDLLFQFSIGCHNFPCFLLKGFPEFLIEPFFSNGVSGARKTRSDSLAPWRYFLVDPVEVKSPIRANPWVHVLVTPLRSITFFLMNQSNQRNDFMFFCLMG